MKKLFIFFAIILSITRIDAQLFRAGTYNLYEGISKGLIKAVATDSIGFVWVATDEGLIRFDGKNAVFFKDALVGGFAKGFLKTKSQALLVVHDFGVTEIMSLPDTTYFRRILPGGNADFDNKLFYPKSLYEDKNKNIWIGEVRSVVRYQKGKIKKYRFKSGTNSGSIYRSFSFAEDASGTLWVVSFDGKLFYLNTQRDAFEEVEIPFSLSGAGSFIKIKNNVFWIGTQDGIYELELDAQKLISWKRLLGSPKAISSALAISADEVFLGTWSDGLHKATTQRGAMRFEKVGDLPFQDVLGLSYSANTGLWVVGGENIVSFMPGFFREIALGSSGAAIEAIGQMPDSTVVVATFEELSFIKIDRHNLKTNIFSIPIDIAPTALLCESNQIWIGTLDGKLYLYDIRQKSLEPVPEISASSHPISSIIKDKAGNIWISGNATHGLIRITQDRRFHFYKKNGLTGSRSLYETKSGVLFVGGSAPDAFLFHYLPLADTFNNVSVPLNFRVKEHFTVEDIATDQDGALLLATSDGLLKFHLWAADQGNNRVERIDLKKVPLNESIKALVLDNDGILWVATASGLVAYDGYASLLFDRSSGLSSNNFTYRGLLFDDDHNFWVGTSKGLELFQRNQSQNSITPKPVFTALKINGIRRRLDMDNKFSIPAHANMELEFLALSFPSDRLQYQTRIIGRDTSEWSAPQSRSNIILSSLPPGEYILQVRAQQHGGFLWSTPQSFSFIVVKSWYQTWWAILLFGGTFLLLLAGAVRLYNWRLLQQKKHLEVIVEARTGEIKAQQQKIIAQNEKYRQLKEKQLQEQIEYKNKQLAIYTLHLIQKNESLKELQLEINKAIRQDGRKDKAELRHYLSLIDYSFRKDDEWEKFKLYFESVHVGFFENLLKLHPNLTPQELRLCALIRLNLSIQESATVLGISPESVKNARFRLRKKMELLTPETLADHIMQF